MVKDKYSRIETTSNRLKEVMDEKGIKQVDIVRATGIPKGKISKYVLGLVIPKSDTIGPIAEFLGVSEMWLWGFDVPKHRIEKASHELNMRTATLTNRMRNDEEFLVLVEQLNALPADQLLLIKGIVHGFVGNKDTKDEVQ